MLEPLKTPNPVTIHDLSPADREKIEIFKATAQARQWRWRRDPEPSKPKRTKGK